MKNNKATILTITLTLIIVLGLIGSLILSISLNNSSISELPNSPVKESTKKASSLTLKEAEKLIFKEDNTYANDLIKSGSTVSGEELTASSINIYGINEKAFIFSFRDHTIIDGNYLTAMYYVGKESKNVYRFESVGGAGSDLYLMKNNSIVATLEFKPSQLENIELTSKDALTILENAYPDYTFLNGGELQDLVYDYETQTERSAYVFTFLKNNTDLIYSGHVFLDGTYEFTLAGEM